MGRSLNFDIVPATVVTTVRDANGIVFKRIYFIPTILARIAVAVA